MVRGAFYAVVVALLLSVHPAAAYDCLSSGECCGDTGERDYGSNYDAGGSDHLCDLQEFGDFINQAHFYKYRSRPRCASGSAVNAAVS